MDNIAYPVLKPAALRTAAAADRDEWNALAGDGQPFVGHDYLAALETCGCVGPGTGWTPSIIALRDDQGLAAAAPAYLKSHSYGEFVFDFAWAQAYNRFGLPYYPKLIVAVPFTPATGPRLLVRSDLARSPEVRAFVEAQLLQAIESVATERSLSSVHLLFHQPAESAALQNADWLARRDCQFHWTNHDYTDYEHYLASFSADKRKKAKRERRRIAESGVSYQTLHGADMTPALLDRIFELHRDTFVRHGHEPYLNRAFFAVAAEKLGRQFMVKAAMFEGAMIACAIFFVSSHTLYGRYWGAAADVHSLHFETCYHQGIDYCIEHRIARFEPGTQGEHKVSRGFEPTLTQSAHWIADARFRPAIADYLRREQAGVDEYAAAMQAHVPYRDRRGDT